MDLELDGKRAVVTGGSRGIGKAIALELAREGADVAIVARDQTVLAASAEEIRAATGRHIVPVVADTSDDDAVDSMMRSAFEGLGGVDILVNAAARPGGQGPVPGFAEVTGDMLWEDMNVKVMGYLRCARAVIPHMRDAGWGRIINISGLAARQTGSITGSIRNVAVAALTKNLADELAGSGINVTVVHPGLTRTEKTAEVVAARAAATGQDHSQIEAAFARSNVLNHLVTAQEVAYVVAFLASPKSIAINGDAIVAGGGAPRAIHY